MVVTRKKPNQTTHGLNNRVGDAVGQSHAAKRRKTTNSPKPVSHKPKPGRRQKGKLANAMNLPIEVFSEICFHLHPLDFLHLTWASKTLRSHLMSKSSKWIWRTARKNQEPDMPDCPGQLTEPQYAALVFTTICQACGNTRASRVHLELYTRHCVRCYDTHIINVHQSAYTLPDCPVLHNTIVPCVEVHKSAGWSRYKRYWCLDSELKAVATKWATLESMTDCNAFIRDRKAVVKAMQKHTSALEEWETTRALRKCVEKQELCVARSTEITQRLLGLDWQLSDIMTPNDIFHYPELYKEWRKLTRKPNPLSEKSWKLLYPKLDGIRLALKARQAEEARLEGIRKRTQQCVRYFKSLCMLWKRETSSDIVFPNCRESELEDIISVIPPIKELIDDSSEPLTLMRWERKVLEILEFLRSSHVEMMNTSSELDL